jgi:hypothetical protein
MLFLLTDGLGSDGVWSVAEVVEVDKNSLSRRVHLKFHIQGECFCARRTFTAVVCLFRHVNCRAKVLCSAGLPVQSEEWVRSPVALQLHTPSTNHAGAVILLN